MKEETSRQPVALQITALILGLQGTGDRPAGNALRRSRRTAGARPQSVRACSSSFLN